jgi:hypothetical protein
VRALPGVRAAGAIDGLFELEAKRGLGLRVVEGKAPEPPQRWSALTWTVVAGDYFAAMSAPRRALRSGADRGWRALPGGRRGGGEEGGPQAIEEGDP